MLHYWCSTCNNRMHIPRDNPKCVMCSVKIERDEALIEVKRLSKVVASVLHGDCYCEWSGIGVCKICAILEDKDRTLEMLKHVKEAKDCLEQIAIESKKQHKTELAEVESDRDEALRDAQESEDAIEEIATRPCEGWNEDERPKNHEEDCSSCYARTLIG